MASNWENHRKSVLSKSDKSFKQSVDAPVLQIVDMINACGKFLTTSSCSGRIMLINEADPSKRKNGAEFIFVSHDLVPEDEYHAILGRASTFGGNVFLKLEPLIIHVECESLELAVRLLHAAKLMGPLKHSCIVSATNNKFVVAIKGLAKLEIPIVYSGTVMTEPVQFSRFLSIANDRMRENFAAIEFLERELRTGLLERLVSPQMQQPLTYDNLRPILKKSLSVTPTLPAINIETFQDKLDIRFRQESVALDKSMRFGVSGDGKKVGIMPDNGRWPSYEEGDIVKVSHPDSIPVAVLEIKREIWCLVFRTKSNKHQRMQWRLIKSQAQISGLFGNSIDKLQLMVDDELFDVEWIPNEEASRKIKVSSFERIGDAIIIDQSLSPLDAEIYANNMRASMVLGKRGNDGRDFEILYCKDSKTRVRHKENGVVYIIDFKIDFFTSALTSSRIRLLGRIKKTETVLEIAESVNCFSISLSAKNAATKILVVVENEQIRALVSESLVANGADNFVVSGSMEAFQEYFPVDRLIVSDSHIESIASLVRPGGILNRVPEMIDTVV